MIRFLTALLLLLPAGRAGPAVPDIDEPLRTGQRSGSDAAVIVGNQDYAFIGDVPYASRDAQAFYRLAVYGLGIPRERVQLLDRGASREMIVEALEQAAETTGRGSRVWVYFAGHGAASPSTGERLLLGDDVRAELASFEPRAVPVSEVRRLAAAGGAEVAMVLDTCWTGVGRSGGDLLDGKRFAVPSYAMQQGPHLEWVATGPDQWSGPYHDARHGAFTYFAVGALRGWADGQLDGRRDGDVTAEEAQLFVEQALQDHGFADQRPVLTVPDGDGVVLARLGEAGEPNPFAHPVPDASAPPPRKVPVVETSEVGFRVEVAPGDSRLASEIEARLDRGVSPCDDFYRFACGGWLDAASIPEGRDHWSIATSEMARRWDDSLVQISSGRVPGGSDQLRSFFDVCMDAGRVEQLGAEPVLPLLQRIDRLQAVEDVLRTITAMPMDALLHGYPDTDPAGSGEHILHLAPGGVGLPARSLEQAQLVVARRRYAEALFRAAGDRNPVRSASEAVEFEQRLAALPGVDPADMHHPLDRAALAEVAPHLPMGAMLDALGVPADASVNVTSVAWLEALDQLVAVYGIDALRPYLKARLLDRVAPWLSSDFVEPWAAYHGASRARPQHCVDLAATYYASDVEQAWVARHFTGRSRDQVTELTGGVLDALEHRLEVVAWLDLPSRARGLDRLRAMDVQLGRPEVWEETGAAVRPGDLFGTLLRAHQSEVSRWMGRVGRADSSMWLVRPGQLTARYAPYQHALLVPAAMVQAPLYEEHRTRALNHGALGAWIGHEASHALDEYPMRVGEDWRLSTSAETWRDAVACVGDPDDPVVEELVADQAGAVAAWQAYEAWSASHEAEPDVAGFTPEQQLFVGLAQSRCTVSTAGWEQQRSGTRPTPARRVNDVLRHVPAFHDAFDCEVGTPMTPAQTCEVW